MGDPPINQWGWITREHFYNDASIRIFSPTKPTTGIEFASGEPIIDSGKNSWDMAFELTTIKLEPTPTGTPTPTPTSTPEKIKLIDYLLDRTGGIGSDVNDDGKVDIADYIALILSE
jgi:hypothetical protein